MTDVVALRARLEGRSGPLSIEVDLCAASGTLVLVGPNGAGKTSVLLMLLGVLPVARGRIELGGQLLLDTASRVDIPVEQRGLGYVPQDYALFPHLTVRENLDFALRCASRDRTARGARVQALLDELKLEALAQRNARALSGGEKQRVALARALSVQPRALLLDEPLAALDAHARREVRSFLAQYLARLTLPTIVVTHDAADARALGERIAVLEAGKIVQTGTWTELTKNPASEFVAEFVGAAPML